MRDVPQRHLNGIRCEEIRMSSERNVSLSGIVVSRDAQTHLSTKPPETVVLYLQGIFLNCVPHYHHNEPDLQATQGTPYIVSQSFKPSSSKPLPTTFQSSPSPLVHSGHPQIALQHKEDSSQTTLTHYNTPKLDFSNHVSCFMVIRLEGL